jgi:hypothetical protein
VARAVSLAVCPAPHKRFISYTWQPRVDPGFCQILVVASRLPKKKLNIIVEKKFDVNMI